MVVGGGGSGGEGEGGSGGRGRRARNLSGVYSVYTVYTGKNRKYFTCLVTWRAGGWGLVEGGLREVPTRDAAIHFRPRICVSKLLGLSVINPGCSYGYIQDSVYCFQNCEALN